MKRKWIVLTIAEPFPVFFSHVNYPQNRFRATAEGPFTTPNSKYYEPPEHEKFVQWKAQYLREHGWTVTVTEEYR